MIRSPFLTDLDTRAQTKGSRDPLGIQQLWTRLGRHVVGNLTTVSNSVRDFTTLLLGYYFAGRLVDDLGPGSELATFLKWEQLAAYARAAVNKDYSFRGTERVRRRLGDGSRVTLSDDRAHQILGNQKVYGLWGLYTVPARASGLLDGDPPRLTPVALEHVENVCLPLLEEGAGKGARNIAKALAPQLSRIDVQGSDAPMVKAIGRVLKQRLLNREREFYRFHLLHGGPTDATHGRQQQFAEIIADTLGQAEFAWSLAMVGNLTKSSRTRGEAWEPLAFRLDRIRTSEAVFAPVSALFVHMLGLADKRVDFVVKRVQEGWGTGLRTVNAAAFAELEGEIADGDVRAGKRWVAIANAVGDGDYKALIELLIEQNKAVMEFRGGAPWIENRGGKLHVRFREETGALPSRAEAPTLWRFSYFLDSLRSVALNLRED